MRREGWEPDKGAKGARGAGDRGDPRSPGYSSLVVAGSSAPCASGDPSGLHELRTIEAKSGTIFKQIASPHR